MDDREFVAAFEACTLPPEEFRHRDHVRLAWVLLREQPLGEALVRFTSLLKRFAASLGKTGLYHETITWAYLFLINERMHRGAATSFSEFARANEDLLTWSPSVLDAYYRPETLKSELARSAFLMPDA
ncbi:MAG TPA: hypothetical protein VN181_05630 [Thermoanaerobaculia bacterium]|nr:hypothetical protein [Thermoanaerobaculia bacterium]